MDERARAWSKARARSNQQQSQGTRAKVTRAHAIVDTSARKKLMSEALQHLRYGKLCEATPRRPALHAQTQRSDNL
eukprot:762444-Hanusia_phi.AAC.4